MAHLCFISCFLAMELCRQCLVRKCWHHQKDLWITLDRLEEELEDEEDCDSGIGDDSPPQTPSDDDGR